MTVYKVSYVVKGIDHPGAILNLKDQPEVGKRIRLGEDTFVITEVLELMPARGDFQFLHATCRPLTPEEEKE